jgi:Outer membrane protein and related peptidoglycan-associated (lipo)proteins
MKKHHFLFLLFTVCFRFTQAQVNDSNSFSRLTTSNSSDNWFIGAGIGGVGTSNHALEKGFGGSNNSSIKLVPPVINIFGGKWITPGIGLRLESGIWDINTWIPHTMISGSIIPPGIISVNTTTTKIKQEILGFDLHGEALFNLNNLIAGYNPERKNSFSIYLGPGFTAMKIKDSSTVYKNLIINSGLIFEHKFNSSIAFFADIKESIIPLYFKFNTSFNSSNIKYEGFASLTIGVTYTFPGTYRGFRTAFLQEEKDKLNKKINELTEDKNKLNNENEKLVKAYDEMKSDYEKAAQSATELKQLIKKYDLPECSKILLCDFVSFDIDKSVYQPNEEDNIRKAANEFAKSKDCVIEIYGYADPSTGTRSYNLNLSKRRAEYVANILKTKYNIPANRIVLKHFGGNQAPIENRATNKIALFFLSKSPSTEPNTEATTESKAEIATSNQETVKPQIEAELPTQSNSADAIATEVMQPGSRLTLLALKYYGDKIFWVYIYEYNKKKIRNPNSVPVGTVLDIPSKEKYGIDSSNPESIAKAKRLFGKIM